MFCKECGNKIPENSKFCQNCGTSQDTIIVEQPKVENKKDNHLANVLCTISLSLYFGMPIVAFLMYFFMYGLTEEFDTALADPFYGMFTLLSMLARLAAYVLMIVARVKCPKSTYAKVVMWIYIGLLILGVVSFIFLVVTCAGMITACSGR